MNRACNPISFLLHFAYTLGIEVQEVLRLIWWFHIGLGPEIILAYEFRPVLFTLLISFRVS